MANYLILNNLQFFLISSHCAVYSQSLNRCFRLKTLLELIFVVLAFFIFGKGYVWCRDNFIVLRESYLCRVDRKKIPLWSFLTTITI